MEETIAYKVVVCDLSTNSVHFLTANFPYRDVDDEGAIDIAELNNKDLENYIEKEMGLDLNFVDYTIFSDNKPLTIYGKEDKPIAYID